VVCWRGTDVSDARDACGFRIEAFRPEDGSSIFLRIVSIYRALILSGLYRWSVAIDRLIASHLAAR
jgi:hypothetical protein